MAFKDIEKLDVAFSLKEIGVPVEYNGYKTYGIFDNEATEALLLNSKQFSVQSTELTLIIGTGSIGTIKNTTAKSIELITIDGTDYKIDKFIPLSNGLETKLWVSGIK